MSSALIDLKILISGTPVYGRYLYRKADGSEFGPYKCLGVFRNTAAGHGVMIDQYNRQDSGTYVWKWEEVLDGDIDHPIRRQ